MAEIVLWNPPEVRPVFRILDWDGNLVEEGPVLTEREVYCDLCNAEVPLRPAPMIGSYVLCLECLNKVEPEWQRQVTPLLKLIWYTQLEEQERRYE